jgi:hypothetical protein
MDAYAAYYTQIWNKQPGARVGIIQPPVPSSLQHEASTNAVPSLLLPYRQVPVRVVPRITPLEAAQAKRKAEKKEARARSKRLERQQQQQQLQQAVGAAAEADSADEDTTWLIQSGTSTESKESLTPPSAVASAQKLAASVFFPSLSTPAKSASAGVMFPSLSSKQLATSAPSTSRTHRPNVGKGASTGVVTSSPMPSPRTQKAFFTAPLQLLSPNPAPQPQSVQLRFNAAAGPAFAPAASFVPSLNSAAEVAYLKQLMKQGQFHPVQSAASRPLKSTARSTAAATTAPRNLSISSAAAEIEHANGYLKQFELQPTDVAQVRTQQRQASPASPIPQSAPPVQASPSPASDGAETASPTRATAVTAASSKPSSTPTAAQGTPGTAAPLASSPTAPARSPRAAPSPAAIAAAAAAAAALAAANAEAVEAYKQQRAEAKARQAEERAAEEAERKRKANEDLARRMRAENEEQEQRRLAEAMQMRVQAHERRERERKAAEEAQHRRTEMAEKHAERRNAEKEEAEAAAAAAKQLRDAEPTAVIVTVSPEATSPLGVSGSGAGASSGGVGGDDFMPHADPLIRACKKTDTSGFQAMLLAKWAQLLYNERNKEEVAEREAARQERERKAANQAAIAAVLEKAERTQAGLKKLPPSASSMHLLSTTEKPLDGSDLAPHSDSEAESGAEDESESENGTTRPHSTAAPLLRQHTKNDTPQRSGASTRRNKGKSVASAAAAPAAPSTVTSASSTRPNSPPGHFTSETGKEKDAEDARAKKRRTNRGTMRQYPSNSSLNSGGGAGLSLDLAAESVTSPLSPITPGSSRKSMMFALPKPAQKVRVTATLPETLDVINRVRKASQLMQPLSSTSPLPGQQQQQPQQPPAVLRAESTRHSRTSSLQGGLRRQRTGSSSSSSSFFPASSSGAEQEAWRRFCAFLERRDANGSTILHHAIWRRQATLIPLLLQMGGPGLVHAQDNLHCTPLHMACLRGMDSAIADLIAAGASIRTVNVKGKMCFELPSQVELAEVERVATVLQKQVQQQMAAGSSVHNEEDVELLNAYLARKTLQLLEAENEAARQAAAAAAASSNNEEGKSDASASTAAMSPSRSARRKTFNSEQQATAVAAALAPATGSKERDAAKAVGVAAAAAAAERAERRRQRTRTMSRPGNKAAVAEDLSAQTPPSPPTHVADAHPAAATMTQPVGLSAAAMSASTSPSPVSHLSADAPTPAAAASSAPGGATAASSELPSSSAARTTTGGGLRIKLRASPSAAVAVGTAAAPAAATNAAAQQSQT